GMRGHAHAEVASATAIAALAKHDEEIPPSDLDGAIKASIAEANSTVRGMVEADASLQGMGTTVTALLYSNNRLCLGHIGDSRAYLLRDGTFRQITKDHTLVQSMVDEGRLTEEQAAVHPQRSLLLRALGTSDSVEADVNMHEARVGDRWLLCSDGLTGVVTEETILAELSSGDDVAEIAIRLVDLANRGGGPDNITCVIADVVDTEPDSDHPMIVGAASETQPARSVSDSAASRAAALTPQEEEPEPEPLPEPRRRKWPWLVVPALLVVVVVLLGVGAWQFTMSQFYLGADQGHVAIYRGLAQPIGPVSLNRLEERTSVRLADLPAYERERVKGTIEVGSREDAYATVDRLGDEAAECVRRRQEAKPTQTSKPGSSPQPTIPAGECSP